MQLDRFDTPLNIPKQETKRFWINKVYEPPGTMMVAVTSRTAIFEGVKPLNAYFKKGRYIHYLRNKHGLMMSDIPQEIYDHEKPIKNAFGDVLVGGLGLGYFPSMIVNKPNVKSIVVVEKEKEIISMIEPYIDKRIKIIHSDLWSYLQKRKAKFDYAYLDIWYGSSEGEWNKTVLPLKRLIRNVYGEKKIDCWKEKEMIGQFMLGFNTNVNFSKLMNKQFTIKDYKFCPTQYAIYSNTGLPTTEKTIKKWTSLFFNNIGSPKWEKYFGKIIDERSKK